MLAILRLLRGSIDFEVSGGYLERFISHCGRVRLPLWGLRRQEGKLTASTALGNRQQLRDAAAKSGVALHITREYGLPAIVARYRLRTGVFAGLAALLLVPVVLSMFIWRIEIVGNLTIPTGQLRETLVALGLHNGAFRRALTAREVERGMLIAHEGLRWVGVNLRGSRAVVEVRERDNVPATVDTVTPHNIVASKGGYITQMNVYDGSPTVSSGDSVLAGELLVSGIMQNGKEQSRTVHARAQVIAQIEDSIAITIPYEQVVFGYRGVQVQRTLLLGKLQLPLDKGTTPTAPYKLERATEPLMLLGIALPLQVRRDNYLLLEQSTEQVSPEEARTEALAQLTAQEQRDFAPDSVISRELTGQELEGKFILFADYVRLADIATEKPILTVE